MRKVFTIIIFIGLVYWSAGWSQGDRPMLERELSRTALRLTRLEQAIRYLRNDQLMNQIVVLKADLQKARKLFENENYSACRLLLISINNRIAGILTTLSENPFFHRKLYRDVKQLLIRAEKAVRKSNSREAEVYLREAVSLFEQAERMMNDTPSLFYRSNELLLLARKLAERSILLSEDTPAMEDFPGEKLQFWLEQWKSSWDRVKNSAEISHETRTKMEMAIARAEQAIQSGQTAEAYRIIRNGLLLLEKLQTARKDINRLMLQYYQQIQQVEELEVTGAGDDLAARLLDRIQQNLVSAEKAIAEEEWQEAKRLLQINYQLLRTIPVLHSEENSEVILRRQLERFHARIEAIPDGTPGLSILRRLEEQVAYHLEKGQNAMAARLLKNGFRFLRIMESQTDSNTPDLNELEMVLNQLEQKVSRLSEDEQSMVRDLLGQAREAIRQGNKQKTGQLIEMINALIED